MRARVCLVGMLGVAVLWLAMLASPVTPAMRLLARYGSIPKGVVLEGKAASLGEIKTVTYDKEKNAFLVNDEWTYANPVTQEAMADILDAIRKDDRIGVSYTMAKVLIVYGELPERGRIAKDLLATDLFLGGVVYGRKHLIKDQKLPEDYEPVRVGKQEVHTACAFAFRDYVFARDEETKTLTRQSFKFSVIVIPLAEKHARDGGHLPNEELWDDGKGFGKTYGKECKPNVDHIEKHKKAYLKMPAVAKSVTYGEAAAFARHLRNSKIDLKKLVKDMKPRRRGFFGRRRD